MCEPLEEAFKRRYKDMNLEVFLLTDGEIWGQDRLFEQIGDQVKESQGRIRVFTLGIGRDVSHALIEGVARVGNGFAQTVMDGEKMDKKILRMLKGALTPHIHDYSLEIKYEKPGEQKTAAADEDDFEIVEKVMDGLSIHTSTSETTVVGEGELPATTAKKPVSLYDPNAGSGDDDIHMIDASQSADHKYDHLPTIPIPRYLQTPYSIPALFPFNRTTVYVMLSDSAPSAKPKSVVLRGTSHHGPLELEIPITHLSEKAATIHQLAARKAVKELEEGQGWVAGAKNQDGKLLKDAFEGRFSDMVEREAVKLGVKYQVGGKWCSFVAVESNNVSGQGQQEIREMTVEHIEDNEPQVSHQLLGMSAAASLVDGGYPGRKRSAAPARGLTRSIMPRRQSKEEEVDDESEEEAYGAPQIRSLSGAESSSTYSIGGAPAPPPPPAPASRSSVSSTFGGLMSKGRGVFGGSKPVSQHTDKDRQEGKKKKNSKFSVPGASSSQRTSELARSSNVKPDENESVVEKVAALQTFIGSWAWSGDLEAVLGVKKAQAQAKISLPNVQSQQDDVLSTLCAVVFLKRKFKDEQDTWEMFVEKAETWLMDQTSLCMEELEKHAEGLF